MKHPTDEEIEKFASDQTKEFDKYLRPASIELITIGAKWARDQQPKDGLTDYQRGYNDGIHAENERGNPEIFRLRKVIEIDRQEIERLKECLRGFVRIKGLLLYADTVESCHEGEAMAVSSAINEAIKLTKP